MSNEKGGRKLINFSKIHNNRFYIRQWTSGYFFVEIPFCSAPFPDNNAAKKNTFWSMEDNIYKLIKKINYSAHYN